MSDQDIRQAARNRLKARAHFRSLLVTWAALSVLFIAIWFFTGADDGFWPIWPILGIGIGVVASGIRAYGPGNEPITESDVDAEVQRMRQRPKAN